MAKAKVFNLPTIPSMNGMIIVEKRMKVPPPNRKGATKYPWAQMEVGDSFFAPGKTTTTLHQAARNFAIKTGWRFTCRKEEGGARIWRIA
jgi:hypothetical protein